MIFFSKVTKYREIFLAKKFPLQMGAYCSNKKISNTVKEHSGTQNTYTRYAQNKCIFFPTLKYVDSHDTKYRSMAVTWL